MNEGCTSMSAAALRKVGSTRCRSVREIVGAVATISTVAAGCNDCNHRIGRNQFVHGDLPVGLGSPGALLGVEQHASPVHMRHVEAWREHVQAPTNGILPFESQWIGAAPTLHKPGLWSSVVRALTVGGRLGLPGMRDRSWRHTATP